jgi:hypothetical protein
MLIFRLYVNTIVPEGKSEIFANKIKNNSYSFIFLKNIIIFLKNYYILKILLN